MIGLDSSPNRLAFCFDELPIISQQSFGINASLYLETMFSGLGKSPFYFAIQLSGYRIGNKTVFVQSFVCPVAWTPLTPLDSFVA